ncbi:MAG: hypothetical protein NUV82_02190 [Candidatus Komeilibacteria bacterium]|nr:hypothetical protein [Candidatus Komeilibacteria bacterium]
MPNFEKPKGLREEIEELIKVAPSEIEREFTTTDNSWMECYESVLFLLEVYFKVGKRAKLELGEEKYEMILDRLTNLRNRFSKLKADYPIRSKIPPVTVREGLIGDLDLLK